MSGPVLASLDEVEPRDAWAHEALHFTPWLAQNLDRLGKVVGIDLEWEQSEIAVGRYAADILARDARDGSAVLIENQLGVSDHGHLGQILTYLTGLKAKTVIWIAPAYRPEHLSALRWLNENTAEPFAFLAVKLRVVRIGDSPLAPLFEVVESPNNWDRQLEEMARAVRETSPQAERRKEFWSSYIARFDDAKGDLKSGGGSSLWHALPNIDLIISQWLSKDGVGVFVRGGKGVEGTKIIERLKPYASTLEIRLGTTLGAAPFPLGKRRNGDVASEADFASMAEWLYEQRCLYATVLRDVLGHEAHSRDRFDAHP